MAYRVEFRDEARRAFLRLDKAIQKRMARVVDRLADNPRPAQATQLVGDPRTWRVRAGSWRILYEIHDDQIVVLILDFEHRSRAYGGHLTGRSENAPSQPPGLASGGHPDRLAFRFPTAGCRARRGQLPTRTATVP